MPVLYEAPGPVSAAGLYSRRGGGAGGGGGGAFGGVGPVYQIHDDTARLQNQLALVGMEGANRISQINAQGNVSSALQENAAYLDAWQFQQKVTAQEASQYRQDMNSIAAIDADPSMSPLEKQQAKLRIKTRVDWVGERQKRDLQQAQVEQAQTHAKLYGMQAKLEEQRIINSAALAEGKIKTMTDPSKVAQLREIAMDVGIDPDSQIGKEFMDKTAAEHGWTQTFPIKPDGSVSDKPIPWGGGEGGAAGGTSGARSGTGKGVQTEESVKNASDDYFRSWEAAAKAAGPGASPGDIEALAKKIMEGHGNAMSAYQANTPEGRKKAGVEIQSKAVEGINARAQGLMSHPLVSPSEKATFGKMLDEMKRLTSKYNPATMPTAIKQRLDQLQYNYERFELLVGDRQRKADALAGRGQPGTVSTGAGNRATIGTDPNTGMPFRETLGAVGDVVRNTAGAIGDVAGLVGGVP